MTGRRSQLFPSTRPTVGMDVLSHLEDLLEEEAHAELWIDPGACTGWATWVTPAGRFFSGQGPWREVISQVAQLLERRASQITLGWEDFVVTPGPPRDTTALRVIGALELTCHRLRDAGLTARPPASPASRRLGEVHLVTAGWHRPGLRDANQAATHLLASRLEGLALPATMIAKIMEAVTHGDR